VVGGVGSEDFACAVDEDGAGAAGADVDAEEHEEGLLRLQLVQRRQCRGCTFECGGHLNRRFFGGCDSARIRAGFQGQGFLQQVLNIHPAVLHLYEGRNLSGLEENHAGGLRPEQFF
jgi:hypothetical protein